MISLLAEAPAGDMSFVITMVLVIAVMYFFMIRPQNRRRKEAEEARKNVEKGDKVVTTGGIIGKIVDLKDTEVTISTADGTKITVVRDYIFLYEETTDNK